MRFKRIGYALIAVVAFAACGYLAFKLSPWPSVLLIRHAFEKDTVTRNRALESRLPTGVGELRTQRYGSGDDESLDVFFPSEASANKVLPTIVWVHGGAFVYGDKSDVASYLRIVAGRGYTTVGVNYSLAPGARYPTPVIQVNHALGFLEQNSERFRIDKTKLFLAGDSAGSQIVAQLAAAISDHSYAHIIGITPAIDPTRLKGLILFCGIYDTAQLNLNGPFGQFLKTVIWSYFGTRDFGQDPQFEEFSVNRHVREEFPPAFISAGNRDPLAQQSVIMADALRKQGVTVDALFFPEDYRPLLPHEYQFDLDRDAGRQALERALAFVAGFAQ